MATPAGYANCSYKLKHSLMSREAYLTFAVDPTGTDPVAIAAALRASFMKTGSLFSSIDSNVSLMSTRVSLGTDGAEDLVGVDNNIGVCSLVTSSLPANCAVLVHKTTARGGRRGRGRMYIPWSMQSANTAESGALIAADIVRVSAAFTVWRLDVEATTGPLVILHRPSEPGIAHPSTPGPPNVVTGHSVDPLVATQRRRLGR